MTKSSKDFDALTKMASDIRALSDSLAEALADPPSPQRNTQVEAIWPQIDRYRTTYSQAVLNLRTQIQIAPLDTASPRDAAAQRKMLIQCQERCNLWDQVAHMIWRQSLPSSFPPLITARREFVTSREFGPVNYLLDVLFHEANVHSPDTSLLPDTHHRDIPLSGEYFLNFLNAAQRLLLAQEREGPVRFLDMGCGGGTKVLAAAAKFDVAHGADFLPEYVAEAQAFFKRVGADPKMIIQADALSFDGYGAYDIIYVYRPLQDVALATQMEERILAQVSPGTIIIAPLNQTLGTGGQSGARVAENLYLAHTSPDEAEMLRDIALTKGSETRVPTGYSEDALGFWRPIVDQSRRNGFALF